MIPHDYADGRATVAQDRATEASRKHHGQLYSHGSSRIDTEAQGSTKESHDCITVA